MAWEWTNPKTQDVQRIVERANEFRDGLHSKVTAGEITPELAGRLMDAHQEGMADVAKALTATSSTSWGDVVTVDRQAIVESLDPDFFHNLTVASNYAPAGIKQA